MIVGPTTPMIFTGTRPFLSVGNGGVKVNVRFPSFFCFCFVASSPLTSRPLSLRVSLFIVIQSLPGFNFSGSFILISECKFLSEGLGKGNGGSLSYHFKDDWRVIGKDLCRLLTYLLILTHESYPRREGGLQSLESSLVTPSLPLPKTR